VIVNKQEFFSRATLVRLAVNDVPNFNGPVYLQELTGADRLKLAVIEDAERENRTYRGVQALLALSIVDENGNRIFDENDLDTIAASLPHRTQDFLYTRAARLSTLTVDELDRAKNG
jgi:hypothetical protein